MRDVEDLRRTLQRIDRRSYKAYKDIRGGYLLERGVELHIDHVQGDPFAAPSKLRLRVAQERAGFSPRLFDNRARRIALQDFLVAEAGRVIHDELRGRRGSGKSGLISVNEGGQEVIDRSACLVTPEWVELRFEAGLPARGRSVLAAEAAALLTGDLPRLARGCLQLASLDEQELEQFVDCVDNQEFLREQLIAKGLVAFVANGSVLPRASGASERPLHGDAAVPFRAPPELQVELQLANPIERDGQRVSCLTGMGVPRGVTLIIGGGYHGKSTLLRALERAVYPHIPGDGREYVVSLPQSVKIRAEDGRRVEAVDISPFIGELPQGRSTRCFRSDDASGSTSQAANIVEAVECGAQVLLLDEDTSATNFMIRDARMQALVATEHEPITPFIDRVRELYDTLGVSSVLVMGGSGDYLDAADTILLMREYEALLTTELARAVAARHPTGRQREATRPLQAPVARIPQASSIDASRGRRDVKIDAREQDLLGFGEERIDLRSVEQLVDKSQTRAIGYAIHLATEQMDGRRTLAEILDALDQTLDRPGGLDTLDPFRRGERHPGNFARPRRFEIAAALNRLRSVRFVSGA